MPDHDKIRNHQHLKIFGNLIHDPNLWHLNRRSVAGGTAIGLFIAFIPIPFQMGLAATAAIFFRVNLPLSVVLVWVSNPITMPPMFYATYKLGAWLLSRPERRFEFELSLQWLNTQFLEIWEPFVLGCLVAGAVCAVLGYVFVRVSWRLHIINRLQERRLKHKLSKKP